MDNLIDRQAAIDAVTEALRGLPVVCKDIAEEAIKQLPPAQPVIVPCDYAKACNEVSMNRIASAVVYMEILEDFKKYGYVLVDMSENMPPANNSEIPNSSDMISRAKAIDALKQQAETMSEWSNRYAEQRKGVLTAVNIVEDLPPALPEPMKIDLSRCSEENWERIKKEWANTPITTIAAEPERIKGHWIEHDDCLTACECSVCHEKYALYEEDVFGRNYCPKCGAKMVVTE